MLESATAQQHDTGLLRLIGRAVESSRKLSSPAFTLRAPST